MKESEKYQNEIPGPEHLDDNELAQYAEFLRHETGRIPEKLVSHVASCAWCRAEIMSITDTLDLLPDLVEEPEEKMQRPPASVGGYLRSRGFRLLGSVAAIAAVVIVTIGVKHILSDRNAGEQVAIVESKDKPADPDSTVNKQAEAKQAAVEHAAGKKVNTDSIQYAKAFLPNPTLENLVGAKYRSGNDPKVLGPEPGAVFTAGDTLKISWSPDLTDEYQLLLIDNQGNTIKEIKPGLNSSLSWKIDLKPGLYYWKFLGRDEMWKVGKIKVLGRDHL